MYGVQKVIWLGDGGKAEVKGHGTLGVALMDVLEQIIEDNGRPAEGIVYYNIWNDDSVLMRVFAVKEYDKAYADSKVKAILNLDEGFQSLSGFTEADGTTAAEIRFVVP